ncbi:MAG: cob(I)yrinic acid a,c-diamide adenosyltransferase [Firmicutes bacterium]|nr:cob(I)yrinic acid a,c-diamide adenosyltransferase [Bacillota bacterium]
MTNGLIHVYHGDGKGKTTAAVGLAVRALGAGLRVHLTQFLKTDASNELKTLKTLKNFSLGDAPAKLPFYFQMNEQEKENYKKYAQSLFSAVENIAASGGADVIILDEILDAVSLGIIPETDLIRFLQNKSGVEVILTGHSASEQILKTADYISKVSAEKHPFEKGVRARKGIEF